MKLAIPNAHKNGVYAAKTFYFVKMVLEISIYALIN